MFKLECVWGGGGGDLQDVRCTGVIGYGLKTGFLVAEKRGIGLDMIKQSGGGDTW